MISDIIRELRKDRNYTQAMLARKLNITQGAVSQWEKGITVPSADQLMALADAFGISIDVLLERENTEAEMESWRIRDRLRNDPALRMLFDAAGRATPDHIRAAAEMLRALEKKGES